MPDANQLFMWLNRKLESFDSFLFPLFFGRNFGLLPWTLWVMTTMGRGATFGTSTTDDTVIRKSESFFTSHGGLFEIDGSKFLATAFLLLVTLGVAMVAYFAHLSGLLIVAIVPIVAIVTQSPEE